MPKFKPSEPPDPITVSEAARRLGVSRQRVSELIAAGRLAVRWVGPLRVLDPRDLDALELLPVGGQRGPRKKKSE